MLNLLDHIVRDADTSLTAFGRNHDLNAPAGHRLAFRELGLSIGLHALNSAIVANDISVLTGTKYGILFKNKWEKQAPTKRKQIFEQTMAENAQGKWSINTTR